MFADLDLGAASATDFAQEDDDISDDEESDFDDDFDEVMKILIKQLLLLDRTYQ